MRFRTTCGAHWIPYDMLTVNAQPGLRKRNRCHARRFFEGFRYWGIWSKRLISKCDCTSFGLERYQKSFYHIHLIFIRYCAFHLSLVKAIFMPKSLNTSIRVNSWHFTIIHDNSNKFFWNSYCRYRRFKVEKIFLKVLNYLSKDLNKVDYYG